MRRGTTVLVGGAVAVALALGALVGGVSRTSTRGPGDFLHQHAGARVVEHDPRISRLEAAGVVSGDGEMECARGRQLLGSEIGSAVLLPR